MARDRGVAGMSVYVIGWLWKHMDGLSATQRLIMLAIADEANDDGVEARPGIRRIADKTGASLGAVRDNLAVLEERGWLVVVRPKRQGRGRYNRYGVVMGRDLGAVRAAVAAGDHDIKGPADGPFVGSAGPLKGPAAAPFNSEEDHGKGTATDPFLADKRAERVQKGYKKGTERVQPGPRGPKTPRPMTQPPPLPAKRKRNLLFDALAAVDGVADTTELTKSQAAHIGKLAAELAAIDASPDDVQTRTANYRTAHPTWECTAAAVVKRWSSLAGSPAAVPAPAESRPDCRVCENRRIVELDPETYARCSCLDGPPDDVMEVTPAGKAEGLAGVRALRESVKPAVSKG